MWDSRECKIGYLFRVKHYSWDFGEDWIRKSCDAKNNYTNALIHYFYEDLNTFIRDDKANKLLKGYWDYSEEASCKIVSRWGRWELWWMIRKLY